MTAAAISGTFATYRHVPSRGVVQLVIEVPVEAQAAAFEALGYPEPGKSLHVAVARLQNTVGLVAHAYAKGGSPGEEMPQGPPTAESEVMPAVPIQPRAHIDTPPSSQTLGAGADDETWSCTHGHDRCDQMYPGPDCPYCEHHQGSSASSAANPLPPANPVAPEGDENRGNRAFKRAIMLCKDPVFQRFAGVDDPEASLPGTAEVFAAATLRTRCQITSRKDLKHNEAARARLDQLVTDFDIWRGRLPEVRG